MTEQQTTQEVEASPLPAAVVALDNPYWDAVKAHVRHAEYPFEGLQAGGLRNPEGWALRAELTNLYSWTITDPGTVAFVAEHAGPRVVDPMAGTGYWAYLLGQLGVGVVASDIAPPDLSEENQYHRAGATHAAVIPSRATIAVDLFGQGRTLLLSWPPYNTSDGADVLAAYPGDRVVYMGAGHSTGDNRMHDVLDQEWTEAAWHRPVQFFNVHDLVTVYDRR